MRRNLIPFFVFSVAALAFAACSGDEPLRPKTAGLVTVIGIVTSIDDQTPVDGGVTIHLDVDSGTDLTLYFGSLYTYPPPSEERLILYGKIRGVRIGDWVKARGRPGKGGISLVDIRVLSR